MTLIEATPADEAGDASEDELETGPLRRCIVTRERQERDCMLRFVIGPGRAVVPDLRATLPGRGIWLSARRDVIETASARGAFARAAKGGVTVPADLSDLIEAGLVRRVTELLGLARRAGQAISGFQKAREWLTTGRAGLVVQAQDGSPEERTRFLSGVRDVPVATPLPGGRLGAVFGRDHIVHVVIAPGRLADKLTIEARRLGGVANRENETQAGTAGRPG